MPRYRHGAQQTLKQRGFNVRKDRTPFPALDVVTSRGFIADQPVLEVGLLLTSLSGSSRRTKRLILLKNDSTPVQTLAVPYPAIEGNAQRFSACWKLRIRASPTLTSMILTTTVSFVDKMRAALDRIYSK